MSEAPEARLRAACEREAAEGFEFCCDVLGVGYADLLALVERTRRLEEALRFYAKGDTWMEHNGQWIVDAPKTWDGPWYPAKSALGWGT